MKNKIDSYHWNLITSRQRMSPWPNIHSMESITKELKDVVGRAHTAVLSLFEGNIMYLFFDQEDFDKEAEHIISLIKKGSLSIEKLSEEVEELSVPFLKWVEEIAKKDLSKLQNKDISDIHRTYISFYKSIYPRYAPAFIIDKKLNLALREILRKKADSSKIDEYEAVLTREPRAMVTQREELSALYIASKISKNRDWKKIFSKNVDYIEKSLKDFKELEDLITKHHQGFFWMTRDYEDPVLTFSGMISRISKHLEAGPVKKLEQIKKKIKHDEALREKITEELRLSKEEQTLFATMRESIHLKELRKSIVSKSLYYYDHVLKEICRRTGLTLRQSRFIISPDEVLSAIKNSREWKTKLDVRIQRSFYLSTEGKTIVCVGEDADKIYNKLFSTSANSGILHGSAASPGKAKGKVRIIMHPNECGKIKEGEILVTIQVVPSFMPAIRKAAALVCDGGTGLTSHPATLAREVGIPCIIGTKIATKILKDGDIVEVDASEGTVKKIT